MILIHIFFVLKEFPETSRSQPVIVDLDGGIPFSGKVQVFASMTQDIQLTFQRTFKSYKKRALDSRRRRTFMSLRASSG